MLGSRNPCGHQEGLFLEIFHSFEPVVYGAQRSALRRLLKGHSKCHKHVVHLERRLVLVEGDDLGRVIHCNVRHNGEGVTRDGSNRAFLARRRYLKVKGHKAMPGSSHSLLGTPSVLWKLSQGPNVHCPRMQSALTRNASLYFSWPSWKCVSIELIKYSIFAGII